MKVTFSFSLRKTLLSISLSLQFIENSALYIQVQIIALSITSFIEEDLASAHFLLLLMTFILS